MRPRIWRLDNEQDKEGAIRAIREAVLGLWVTLGHPTRTNHQNALLHAVLTEISLSTTWDGEFRDVETWKRLLIAAWCRTRDIPVLLLRSIDGHGVDMIPARSSELTTQELSDLMEFIYAWQSENATM